MSSPSKLIAPVVVLVAVAVIVGVMYMFRVKPSIEPAKPKPILVEATAAATQSATLVVRAQGTVEPLRETVLIPEVSGRVVEVTPAFEAGGFFEEGDVLLQIERSTYAAAVAQAEFNLEQARLRLEQEKARADQARREWESLSEGEPPPLAVREPQLRAEEASIRWAAQALDKARLDLDRTTVRAPYAGMVRSREVDLGQFVAPGNTLGRIFAVDVAEVRLPLSADELAYIDLPRAYRGENFRDTGAPVVLRARLAGEIHTWPAHIVRTEGVVNPTNRMTYAVARVENPYAREPGSDRPPLQMGTFVEAEIEGRTFKDVVVLPRRVLRGSDRVLVIGETGELRSRSVNVLRTDETQVVIAGGLAAGDRVCTTALDFVVEGMQVELVTDPTAIDPSSAARIAADADVPSTTTEPTPEGGTL